MVDKYVIDRDGSVSRTQKSEIIGFGEEFDTLWEREHQVRTKEMVQDLEPEAASPELPESVLVRAERIVNGARQGTYGSPEDNFTKIAQLWTAYRASMSTPIFTAQDVACMMILLKVARIQSGHYAEDNWVDVAGYAACGDRIQKGEKR